jgi:hypothetical protein
MDTVPLLIILTAVVLIGAITFALRKTIKHDRAAIRSDMDEAHEIQTYNEQFRKEQ